MTAESEEHFEYEKYAAVRETGKDPVRAAEPGFGPHLDRDGDGADCHM